MVVVLALAALVSAIPGVGVTATHGVRPGVGIGVRLDARPPGTQLDAGNMSTAFRACPWQIFDSG